MAHNGIRSASDCRPGEFIMSAIIPEIPDSVHRAVPAWIDHIALDPAFRNAAIARCCRAWTDAQQTERANGTAGWACYLRANEAYRNAMPPLTSGKNIRDFTACIAHGLMMRVFLPHIASRLLYAAQVAARAQRQPSGRKNEGSGRPGKNAKPRAQRGSARPTGAKTR